MTYRPAYWIDPDDPRARALPKPLLDVVVCRNSGGSWRQIARDLGQPLSTVRSRWATANRRVRGDAAAQHASRREDPTIGNERHARGVPLMTRGVGGATGGSRPGDPTWHVDEIATVLPRRKTRASVPIDRASRSAPGT